jgi:hypothetical protein
MVQAPGSKVPWQASSATVLLQDFVFLGTMTFSITTFSLMTLSIMRVSKTTLNIMTARIMVKNATLIMTTHNITFCRATFMLSVAIKHYAECD